MPNFSVGGIEIDVEPRFTGTHRQLVEGISEQEAEAPNLGVEVEPRLTARFKRELVALTREAASGVTVEIEATPALRAGFKRELTALVREAAAGVTVQIEATPSLRKGFKRELVDLVRASSAGITTKIEATPALAKGFKSALREQIAKAQAGVKIDIEAKVQLARGSKTKLREELKSLLTGLKATVPVTFNLPNARTVKVELNRVLDEAGARAEIRVGINLPNPRTLKIELRKALLEASDGVELKIPIKVTNPRTLKIELRKALAQAQEGLEIKIPVHIVGGATAKAEARALAASISREVDVPIAKAGRGQQFAKRALDGVRTAASKAFGAVKLLGIGVGLLAVGIAAVGTAGVKAAADLEAQRRSLQLLLGSAREGNKVFEQLLKVANTTPFEIPQVLQTARQLIVAGKGGKELLPTLKTLSDITAELGGSGGNLAGVAIALAKISGQGKVTQRELRTIFTNLPGFSPIQAIAKELGVSIPQAFKKITASQVPAQVAIDALLKGMREFPGAAGAAAKITAETFKGALSNLPDLARTSFFNAFQTALPELTKLIAPGGPIVGILDRYLPAIAEAFVPIAKLVPTIVLAGAPAFNQLVQGVLPVFTELGRVAGPILKGLEDALTGIVGPFDDLVHSIGTLVLDTVPLLAPLGKLIGDLFSTVSQAIDSADFSPIQDALAQAVTTAGDVVRAIGPLLPFAIRVASTIGTMFQGALQGASLLATALTPINKALGNSKALATAVGIVIGGLLLVKTLSWVQGIGRGVQAMLVATETTKEATIATTILSGVIEAVRTAWVGVQVAIGITNTEMLAGEPILASLTVGAQSFGGSLAAAGAALAPFAAAVAIGGTLYLVAKYLRDSKKKSDEFYASLKKGARGDSLNDTNKRLNTASRELDRLEQKFGNVTGRRFQAVGEFFNPFGKNTVQNLQAQIKAQQKNVDDLEQQSAVLQNAAQGVADRLAKVNGVKLDPRKVALLFDQFNVDPNKVGGLSRAIDIVTQKILGYAAATQNVKPEAVQALFALGKDAAEAVALATDKAATSFNDFIDPLKAFAGQTDVTQAQIIKFFKDTGAKAFEFTGNIRKAIEQGYDPAFISQILESGPAQAGPFLDALVRGQSDGFRKQFEAAQKSLQDISSFAVEQARLNNLAVNASTQQMANDLKTALAVSQAEAVANGTLTAQELAKKLKLGLPEVKRAIAEYGLTVAEGLNPVLTGIGQKPISIGGGRAVFAEGGYVHGPDVRRDVVPAMLMPGEVVIRRDSVQRFGRDALLDINRGRVPDGWHAPQRFAEGGVVAPEAIRRGQSYARSQVGKPYVWGAVGPGGFDCSGLWSAIISAVVDQRPRRLFTSSSIVDQAKKIGMQPGLGQVAVGARQGNPGHVAGTIGGQNYEATPPRVLGPGRARGADAAMFTGQWHLGTGYWAGPGGFDLPKPPVITKYGLYGQSATAAMKKLYDEATAWADANTFQSPTSLGSLFEQGAPTGDRGPNVPLARQALYDAIGLTGVPYSWFPPLWRRMGLESNYDPLAVNNTDINALRGDPSKGLMQVIGATFRRFALPGHDSNIFDPVSNVAAAIRYIIDRYGDAFHLPQFGGYENGGLITHEQIVRVGEKNKAEVIVPLTKPDKAFDVSDRSGLTAMLLERAMDGGKAGGSGRHFEFHEGAIALSVAPPAAASPDAYASSMHHRIAPMLAAALAGL